MQDKEQLIEFIELVIEAHLERKKLKRAYIVAIVSVVLGAVCGLAAVIFGLIDYFS